MEKNTKPIIKTFVLCLFTSVATTSFINGATDETLSNCVVDIVREGSNNMSLLDFTLVNVEDDLIISSLHKLGGLRFISRTFSFDYYRIYNNAYIIESENLQVLSDGLSQVVNDRQWNPKARFLIILKNLKDRDVLNLTNWFSEHNVDDVFFITPKRKIYAVYKLNVASNNYCHTSSKWALVSSCSEHLTEKKIPVLRRQQSIRNCRFKFITYNMWPFTNFDDTNREGIEQRVLRDFEKYKNVKIELHTVMEETDAHGVIVPISIKSMLKSVQDNKFEGAVGGFITTTGNELLSQACLLRVYCFSEQIQPMEENEFNNTQN
ncbi:unnamed protein product [Arctia plantaginis]|uniref:Uncharacterized protein n=1 Tax=Arctia plantaginis TaxID=874455 RepID=A0A8S1AN11_ARCPL|nr:unnamed protein product [Arctia plantaginis]